MTPVAYTQDKRQLLASRLVAETIESAEQAILHDVGFGLGLDSIAAVTANRGEGTSGRFVPIKVPGEKAR